MNDDYTEEQPWLPDEDELQPWLPDEDELDYLIDSGAGCIVCGGIHDRRTIDQIILDHANEADDIPPGLECTCEDCEYCSAAAKGVRKLEEGYAEWAARQEEQADELPAEVCGVHQRTPVDCEEHPDSGSGDGVRGSPKGAPGQGATPGLDERDSGSLGSEDMPRW